MGYVPPTTGKVPAIITPVRVVSNIGVPSTRKHASTRDSSVTERAVRKENQGEKNATSGSDRSPFDTDASECLGRQPLRALASNESTLGYALSVGENKAPPPVYVAASSSRSLMVNDYDRSGGQLADVTEMHGADEQVTVGLRISDENEGIVEEGHTYQTTSIAPHVEGDTRRTHFSFPIPLQIRGEDSRTAHLQTKARQHTNELDVYIYGGNTNEVPIAHEEKPNQHQKTVMHALEHASHARQRKPLNTDKNMGSNHVNSKGNTGVNDIAAGNDSGSCNNNNSLSENVSSIGDDYLHPRWLSANKSTEQEDRVDEYFECPTPQKNRELALLDDSVISQPGSSVVAKDGSDRGMSSPSVRRSSRRSEMQYIRGERRGIVVEESQRQGSMWSRRLRDREHAAVTAKEEARKTKERRAQMVLEVR